MVSALVIREGEAGKGGENERMPIHIRLRSFSRIVYPYVVRSCMCFIIIQSLLCAKIAANYCVYMTGVTENYGSDMHKTERVDKGKTDTMRASTMVSSPSIMLASRCICPSGPHASSSKTITRNGLLTNLAALYEGFVMCYKDQGSQGRCDCSLARRGTQLQTPDTHREDQETESVDEKSDRLL
jgi:hypothetical protein